MPFPPDKMKEFTKALRSVESYDDFRALLKALNDASYYLCVGERNAVANVTRIGTPYSDRITFSLIDLSGKVILEGAHVSVASMAKICTVARR